MSNQQILREYPWMSAYVEGVLQEDVDDVEVLVSRISLELFLRREECEWEEFDGDYEEGTPARGVHFSFLKNDGEALLSSSDDITLLDAFRSRLNLDEQNQATYVLEQRDIFVEGRHKHTRFTLYKPPHGYESVRAFVQTFRQRLRQMKVES